MRQGILIGATLAAALIIGGCAKEVHPKIEQGQDLSGLTVKGFLVSDPSSEYPSVIENNVVTVQVPYYLSDTEEIQGDLTKMKLKASLPIGAIFEPGLSGEHNLIEGFRSTLKFADGREEELTFKAAYKKSDKASITKVTLPGAPAAVISFEMPSNGEKGKVNILNTSSSLLEATRSGIIEVSPWATWETAALNPDGTINFFDKPEIKVIAQDGSVSIYEVKINYPSFVKEGEVGYISCLFELSPSLKNTMGFEKDKNRSLAVVGNYLIISELKRNFLVFDRFKGTPLTDIKVNFEGWPEAGDIHAITSDDAGHLVAMTLAAHKNTWVPNTIFDVYAWTNGINQPPVKIVSGDIVTDPVFDAYRKSHANSATATWDVGRKIGVRGDVTKGDAVITTLSPQLARIMVIALKDGAVQEIKGTAWGLSVWGNNTAVIPLDTRPNGVYIHNETNPAMRVVYASPADNIKPILMLPKASWWTPMLNGMGYVEFNGMKLIGLMNSFSKDTQFYSRLVVVNISNPNPQALATGEILDSRLDNYDHTNGRPVGKGQGNPTRSGFTSFYHPDGSIGANGNKTGDVTFGKDTEGNAVQVYMLSTSHGVLAYELTKYDL